jgi:site-specific recombinase XerC
MFLTLPELALMLREAVADGRWKDTRLGEYAGGYLDSLRYAEMSQHTLSAYEYVLGLFCVQHADLELEALEPPRGGLIVRGFLDRNWHKAAPRTRRQRLAILRAWLTWMVGEGILKANPATNVRAPKEKETDRRAHPMARVQQIVQAQDNLRDQVCLMLLGYMGLRKNELRTLKLRHIDLGRNEILIHGKGGHDVVAPIGFQALRDALYLHLQERGGNLLEYLIYPHNYRLRPMDPASVHRWWSKCLERAGVDHFPMHELRHSAAQAMYDATGDPILAQQLLRHSDLKTTRRYLHPSQEVLRAAMGVTEQAFQVCNSDEAVSGEANGDER